MQGTPSSTADSGQAGRTARQADTELHDVADIDVERPNVIVTGSSGMIGYRVCQRLADAGYFVFGFDRVGFPEPPKGPYVRDVEFDVTNYSNVRWAMEDVRKARGERIASVVHLAAYYDFSGADSPLYEKVTVEGTDRLLNHLQSFELEQFIFSSTMLVHKPCEPGEHINEEWPLEGKWPYPKGKIKTEKLIMEGHPQINSVCCASPASTPTGASSRRSLIRSSESTRETSRATCFQATHALGNRSSTLRTA